MADDTIVQGQPIGIVQTMAIVHLRQNAKRQLRYLQSLAPASLILLLWLL